MDCDYFMNGEEAARDGKMDLLAIVARLPISATHTPFTGGITMSSDNTQTLTPGQIYDVPLAELSISDDQPRKYINPEAVKELQASIESVGLLNPIQFRVDDEGNKIIVTGQRRWEAFKNLKKESIPARYYDGDAKVAALVENLLREDINPIDEAEALAELKEAKNCELADLSRELCKAVSTLSEIISLSRLPDWVKNKARKEPKVSRRRLLEISKAKDLATMKRHYKNYEQEMSGAERRRQPVRVDASIRNHAKMLTNFLSGDFTLEGIEDEAKRTTTRERLEALNALLQEKLGTTEG